MSRIIVVAAHPDDEVLGMGGTIKRHLNSGDEVKVLFLTAGERGCPGLTVEETKKVRLLEATAVASLLGYSILDCWHLPDGQLRYSVELRDKLSFLMEQEEPDIVYVTHEHESHQDHRAAARLVREALKTLVDPPECLGYEVWTPLRRADRVSDISDQINDKTEAIKLYQSQLQRQNFLDAAIGLNRYRGVLQGRCEYAECFGKIRPRGDEGMKIGVALLTYAPSADHPRAEYARRTLSTTLSYLDPGYDNELHVHIADDGSAPEHIEQLIEIARGYGYEPSVTNAERGGYGKSYNLMMQAIHSSCDLILPLEDDWELTQILKLESAVKALANPDSGIRSIRLGYLGFTQELRGTAVFRSGQTYLLLDPESPEPHVFCGHPRLETVEYERDIGAWPEGLRAGDTEWEITKRWPARTGVAWPLDLGIPASQDWGGMYIHIGSVSFNQDIPEGAAKGG